MGVNIEDEELVKIFNPTLKRREAILFFLIVVINCGETSQRRSAPVKKFSQPRA